MDKKDGIVSSLDLLEDDPNGSHSAMKTTATAAMSATTTANTTTTTTLTMMDQLDDDALRSILVRTAATDHRRLQWVNRRFYAHINSSLFAKERARQEWAETRVHMIQVVQPANRISSSSSSISISSERKNKQPSWSTPTSSYMKNGRLEMKVDLQDWNQVMPSWGRTTSTTALTATAAIEAAVVVDEQVAGHISAVLVKRTHCFWHTCAVNPALYQTGRLLFDNHGRPVFRSMRRALSRHQKLRRQQQQSDDGDDENHHNNRNDRGFLLFVEDFQLRQEYMASTRVGADALRAFVNHPLLQDAWAVCVYRAPRSQMNRPDDSNPTGSRTTTRDQGDREPYKDQMMRLFLRAGFEQTPEAVFQSDDDLYLFTVPSDVVVDHDDGLIDGGKNDEARGKGPRQKRAPVRMMSHEQAMAIRILEKPQKPPPATGSNLTLQQFLLNQNHHHHDHHITIMISEEDPNSTQNTSASSDSTRQEIKDLQSALAVRLEEMRYKHDPAVEEAEMELRQTKRIIKKLRSCLKNRLKGQQQASTSAGPSTNSSSSNRSLEHLKRKQKKFVEKLTNTEILLDDLRASRLDCQERIEALEIKIQQLRLKYQQEYKQTETFKSREGYLRTHTTKLLSQQDASIADSYALHASAKCQHPSFLEWLIEQVVPTTTATLASPTDSKKDGASSDLRLHLVNALDSDGMTPLMQAVMSPHRSNGNLYRTVTKLIALGADVNLQDVGGETAYDKFRKRFALALSHVPSANPHRGDVVSRPHGRIARRTVVNASVLRPDQAVLQRLEALLLPTVSTLLDRDVESEDEEDFLSSDYVEGGDANVSDQDSIDDSIGERRWRPIDHWSSEANDDDDDDDDDDDGEGFVRVDDNEEIALADSNENEENDTDLLDDEYLFLDIIGHSRSQSDASSVEIDTADTSESLVPCEHNESVVKAADSRDMEWPRGVVDLSGWSLEEGDIFGDLAEHEADEEGKDT